MKFGMQLMAENNDNKQYPFANNFSTRVCHLQKATGRPVMKIEPIYLLIYLVMY